MPNLQRLLDWVSRGFDQGRLEFIAPDGRTWHLGCGEPLVRLRLREASVLWRIVRNPELRLGETYMDGGWTPENPGSPHDLLPAFEIGLRIAALRSQTLPFQKLRQRAAEFAERNTPQRARRNVAHHYDLDNDFYRRFLDAGMHYSCAYFADIGMSLEAAQIAKCEHIARKLQLRPGARVLDIGCGWGGLSLHLARHHGAKVTGVTLSTAQHALATQHARDAGLEGQVEFRLQDYRNTQGQFDGIVSVGMFEHVGRPQYATFFERVRSLLAPDGVALLHTIGRLTPPGSTNPWIRKYIFPGGYIPAASEVLAALEPSGLELADLEVWRLHYARTCQEWNRRFQAARGEIAARFGERFCRMWEFYLQVSEAGFRWDSLVVFHLQMIRRRDRLPLTRAYLHD